MYAPPPQQTMVQGHNINLESLPGVVVYQHSQWLEALAQAVGVPYEAVNKYKIAPLPPGKFAARDPEQFNRWQPSIGELKGMPEMMRAQEESSCCHRILMGLCGCLNLRELTMHFINPLTGEERYRAQRPCKLGGCCCCPLETQLSEMSVPLGKIMEDFDPYCGKCCESACCCTYYTKVYANTQGREDHRYTIRTNTACCGRVNNCCGATCCKNDLIIDILDSRGQLVSTIQKTFGGGNGSCCEAWCRMNNRFDNYIVEFPPKATAQERALLIMATLHIDYQLFEKSGKESSSGDTSGGGD